MVNQMSLPEEEILAKLCDKYEVKQELIHELLVIERGYQDHAKRRGIFQQISELIKADMGK
jgi:hypothetical protein